LVGSQLHLPHRDETQRKHQQNQKYFLLTVSNDHEEIRHKGRKVRGAIPWVIQIQRVGKEQTSRKSNAVLYQSFESFAVNSNKDDDDNDDDDDSMQYVL